jgi:hypothetical protein
MELADEPSAEFAAAFRPFVDFEEPAALGATKATTAAAAHGAGSLLSRVPFLAWVLLGCVLLFAVSFYVYYTRRKGVTKARDTEELDALRKQLAEAREDIDALIQQHAAMAGGLRATTSQLRNVNELARSVEHGLAEALDSWSQTVQELRSEFEVVAVEEEEEEEEQQEGQEQEEEEEEEEERREAGRLRQEQVAELQANEGEGGEAASFEG